MKEQIPLLSGQILKEEIEAARNELSTDRLDISFGEIMGMYERGEIIISPQFQRLYRWSDYQKTRFMESILLGIPIPPIFVAEDDDGRWELVDGLQRLSTVLSFCGYLRGENSEDKNDWTMMKGDIVDSLKDHSYEALPLKFQLNIKRSTCRVEIIQWNSNYDMRYELFNRLNTGGSPLTDQEIRNCIFRGKTERFNEFLKELSSVNDFKKLVSASEKQLEELYLEELVLRFSSLYLNKDSIKDNISQHMTNFMRNVVDGDIYFNYDDMRVIFKETFLLLNKIGVDVFKGRNNTFSSSLFDGVLIGISENIDYYKSEEIPVLEKKIQELKENESFQKVMGSKANVYERVNKRIKIARDVFSV